MKFWQKIKNIIKPKLLPVWEKLFPNWRYETKKKQWEKQWSVQEFDPGWKIKEIPPELKEAVDTGWFPPGASVLDIGCGSGEISAWLAEKGFRVTGIDYSESAIKRAKLEHGEITGKLEFKTVDICNKYSDISKFNVLFDRGCFHAIPKSFASKRTQSLNIPIQTLTFYSILPQIKDIK